MFTLCLETKAVCLTLVLQNIKPDFSNFDADAAWPYLLDEFVDYMREKKGIKVEQ